MPKDHLLTLPALIGRRIVEDRACLMVPLLGLRRFIKLARECGVNVDERRLAQLERLGVFKPVYRVRDPDEQTSALRMSGAHASNAALWFDKGWAEDGPSGVWGPHELRDDTRESYYSRFQVPHLAEVVKSFSINLHLDGYLEDDAADAAKGAAQAKRLKEIADSQMASWRAHQYQPAMALLCQYISNRYHPHALSDQRSIRISKRTASDIWTLVDTHGWEWEDFARSWDPKPTATLFDLTPQKLAHAHSGLLSQAGFVDPLDNWRDLVQFVSLDQRQRLKGEAQFAELIREGATMLRLLHRDLYGEVLADERHGRRARGNTIEAAVREDPRRQLEFAANRFGVNPQPKLVLFLEGQSEADAANAVFRDCFGAEAGKYGIEIVTLGGVSAATGGKLDRYRAIFRLVDYLHSLQTLTFIVLDREGQAEVLKRAAKDERSIHNARFVTRMDRVKLWKTSFEFDNFSAGEIANALNAQCEGKKPFKASDVNAVKRRDNPGAELKRLFEQKAGASLDKIKLTASLIEIMHVDGRKHARPFVQVMRRVARLASLNPLPTSLELYDINQNSPHLAKQIVRRRTGKPAKARKRGNP
jgi:hypothetical protein